MLRDSLELKNYGINKSTLILKEACTRSKKCRPTKLLEKTKKRTEL